MSLMVDVLSNHWLFNGQNLPRLSKLLVTVADSRPKVPTLPPQGKMSLPHGVLLAREKGLDQEKVGHALSSESRVKAKKYRTFRSCFQEKGRIENLESRKSERQGSISTSFQLRILKLILT
jgi:hypothetical protein